MNITELRSKFRTSFSVENYYEGDVSRLSNDDAYAEAFLRHNHENLDAALRHIDECFRWRKLEKIYDVKASDFPLEFHEKGSVYWHSHDKDGHRILYFCIKNSVRDTSKAQLVKLFVAWQLERESQRDAAQRIVVLFDLTDAGLGNFDLDLIKFINSCFSSYFPYFLAYLLVYDMPWILNAAWKIVRGLLSEEAQKYVIFSRRSDIQQYINREHLWLHMGGSNTYQYHYEAEEENSTFLELSSTPPSAFQLVNAPDQSLRFTKSEAVSDLDGFSSSNGIANRSSKQSNVTAIPRSDSMRNVQHDYDEKSEHVGLYLTISPAEQLVFSFPVAAAAAMNESPTEVEKTITLTNQLTRQVAFKVNTTSPENYRVRPSFGVIPAASCVAVRVVCKQTRLSTPLSASADKFQILALPIAMDTAKELIPQLIKTASSETLQEHRLKCLLRVKSGSEMIDSSSEEITVHDESLANVHNQLVILSRRFDALEQYVTAINCYFRMFYYLMAVLLLLVSVDFLSHTVST